MAEMKREVAQEKAQKLADMKARKEEQLNAPASKDDDCFEAAGPEYQAFHPT